MELRKSISELYRVFQPYRLGDDFTGCNHCVDPRESEKLAKARLQDLTLGDLRRYAFKAMTTWGEVRHFKHFLPRLFELAADAPGDFELEILFGKLQYAKWEEWSPVERDCVDQYLRAFWMATICQSPADECDERVSTVLCALGNACTSVLPFLDAWIGEPGDVRAQQLAQFILVNYDDVVTRNRLANAYWGDHERSGADVIAWLKGSQVAAYLKSHHAGIAEWQGAALSLLDAIQAAR
jgi:hypothetical protein